MTAHEGGFRDPRVLLPFILITLIWGSTWYAIKDQLADAEGIADDDDGAVLHACPVYRAR